MGETLIDTPNSDSGLTYRVGPYVVDGRTREVSKDGTVIPLTETEFGILFQLVQKKGELILRDDFTACASRGHKDLRHVVDEHVVHIRLKLGQSVIKTERGKGYRLGQKFIAENVPSPDSSDLERQLSIALDQITDHTDPSFRAAILNCEELLLAKKVPDAYAALALSYINRGHVGFCRELQSIAAKKSTTIIDEAIQLFPTFGSAYALRGLAKLIYAFDWDGAERDFKKCLELSPDNEYGHSYLGHLQVGQGKFEEGLAHARTAAMLDYSSSMTVITESWMMYLAGRPYDAIALGEKVVKRFDQSAPAHSLLGHAYCEVGAVKKAVKQYEIALSIAFLPEVHASLGFLYGREGRPERALKHLREIHEAKTKGTIAYVSSLFAALVYAGIGSTQKALDSLERAFEENCDWLIHLGVEPRWKLLRREKRFRRLLQKVGLSN